MTDLQDTLSPFYPLIKTIHLLFVAMWTFSTAVAYTHYVVPVYRRWLKNKNDPALRDLRNWAFDAFDRGVILEHVAFPIILITGVAMVWLNGWPLDQVSWLTVKLVIVALIFLPMEIVDYHLSHFGGRKALALAAGDAELYERRIHFHWKFFVTSAPLIIAFAPLTYYLAVAKPF